MKITLLTMLLTFIGLTLDPLFFSQVNIYCIEVKPQPEESDSKQDTETIYSWRKPLDLLSENFDSLYDMENIRDSRDLSVDTTAITTTASSVPISYSTDDDEISTLPTESRETSVILVVVLLVAALFILVQ